MKREEAISEAVERYRQAPKEKRKINMWETTIDMECVEMSLEDLETLKPLLTSFIEYNTKIGGLEMTGAHCSVGGEVYIGTNEDDQRVAWVRVSNEPAFYFLTDSYIKCLQAIGGQEHGND